MIHAPMANCMVFVRSCWQIASRNWRDRHLKGAKYADRTSHTYKEGVFDSAIYLKHFAMLTTMVQGALPFVRSTLKLVIRLEI